jgi:2-polyprenyl-3-methyl-5-hydroxy-6-metoxy-1,4-benzoquinol methylase
MASALGHGYDSHDDSPCFPSASVAMMRARLKAWVLDAARWLLGREVVVLPPEARATAGLLTVQAPYRVEEGRLTCVVAPPDAGTLTISLSPYRGHFPAEPIWSKVMDRVPAGPTSVTVDVALRDAVRDDTRSDPVPRVVLTSRRFVLDFVWSGAGGRRMARRTGHYVPGDGNADGAEYYHGDNYVDHDAQTAAEWPAVLELLRAVDSGPRVLDVGCATGGLVHALRQGGFDACGADRSSWAIAQAVARTGPHAWVWDASATPPPPALVARGPFDTVVLWVTLEHFPDPWRVVEALGVLVSPHARLIIKTTNADSLTRWLFGPQWEGHFDPTHHGVAAVGVQALRRELPALGWHVVSLTTERVWDSNADPTHATLREWWAADARFRALLAERDLGDLVTVVAERV